MTATEHPQRTRRSAHAVLAGGSALLLTGIGSYLDTPFKASGDRDWAFTSDQHGVAELPLLVAFAVIGTAVVFGIVVARGLRRAPEQTAVRAVATAAVGVASLAAFWTGLPMILAVGAATLALNARARLHRTTPTVAAALTCAALTTLAAIWLAISG